MFRGREVQHPELGERLLRRLADDLEGLGRVESQPNLDGRNMVMVLAPKKDTKEVAQPSERRERAARS
jgi:translation initiation factor IF-3